MIPGIHLGYDNQSDFILSETDSTLNSFESAKLARFAFEARVTEGAVDDNTNKVVPFLDTVTAEGMTCVCQTI